MGALHGVTVAAASFLALVFVMVFIHEMGHLLAAKAFGVRVKSFSVGIGPRLFGLHVGETDYKICLFPIGGYVKMKGAQSGESGGKNPHPRWQRMMICFAGPAANFALAFFLMAVYYAAFNETPRLNLSTPTVDWTVPGSDAARAGIRAGDVIQSFDSVQNPDWGRLQSRAEAHFGQVVPVTVIRGSGFVNLDVRMPNTAKFGVEAIGLLPNLTGAPIGVASVKPSSPAEAAGIRKGDQIVTVDGLKVHFIDTLTSYIDRSGKPVTIGLLRNGRMQSVLVDPHFTRGAWRIGIRSAGFPVKRSPLPLGPAISKTALYCVSGTGVIGFFASAAKHHKIVFWSLSAPVLVGVSYRARLAPWCRGITSSITSRIFVRRKDRISGNRHRAIAVTTDARS